MRCGERAPAFQFVFSLIVFLAVVLCLVLNHFLRKSILSRTPTMASLVIMISYGHISRFNVMMGQRKHMGGSSAEA